MYDEEWYDDEEDDEDYPYDDDYYLYQDFQDRDYEYDYDEYDEYDPVEYKLTRWERFRNWWDNLTWNLYGRRLWDWQHRNDPKDIPF